jgi:hypothetical protein
MLSLDIRAHHACSPQGMRRMVLAPSTVVAMVLRSMLKKTAKNRSQQNRDIYVRWPFIAAYQP